MIGGDLLLEDYKFTTGSNRELFKLSANPINWFSAISIMFCMMTANDANFMDYLFEYGVVNVALMCAFAAFLNIAASYLFISTWRFNFGNQYADIVKDTFGWGQHTIRIIYIITLLYTSITNAASVHDTIRSVVDPRLGAGNILSNNYFIFYCIIPVFTIPFVFFKRFSSLRFYFMIANLAVLVILIATIFFFVDSYKVGGFDPQKKFTIVTGDFWGLIESFSAFTTLFWSQPFICNVATDLPKTSQNYVLSVVIFATIFVAIINFAISFFGHLNLWGEAGENDFLDYYSTENLFTPIAQVASIINLLITNSGYLIIAARQTIFLFSDTLNNISLLVGSVMAIFICGAFVYYYLNGYENIIELIGSISYSIMALILPPILYLKAFGVKKVLGVCSLIHLLLCLAITGCIIRTYF